MVAVKRREWPTLSSDPEAIQNMARALLLRAVRDLVNYRDAKKPKHRRIYEEVRGWMYEGVDDPKADPNDQLMSFEGICGILGWDPDWLRKRVKLLKKSDLAKLGKNGTGVVR